MATDECAAGLPSDVALEVRGLGPLADKETETLYLRVPVFPGAGGRVCELRREGFSEFGHCRYFAGIEMKPQAMRNNVMPRIIE